MAAASEEAAERATAEKATERLTFFSDAVIAIAITLLAIELPVPDGDTDAAFFASLAHHRQEYVTFLISFVVIGSHWLSHHRVFRYLDRADRPLLTLNLLWLLLIVLNPFLTKVVNEGELTLGRFSLYAGAQAIQLAVFAAMLLVADRRGWFADTAPVSLTRHGWLGALIMAAGFALSIPLHLVLGGAAINVWWLVPVVLGRITDRVGLTARRRGLNDGRD